MKVKKRVIKDYDSLPEEIKDQIKVAYPRGFAKNLLRYTDHKGKRVSALPFDTEDVYYLVRMTVSEAIQIIEEDEDYNDGVLRDDFEINETSDDEILNKTAEEEEEVSDFEEKEDAEELSEEEEV